VEPVGRWYEAFCSRRHHKQTLSHDSLVSSSSEDEEIELDLDDEDDSQLLSSLDPKEWKVNEHLLSCCCYISKNKFLSFCQCDIMFVTLGSGMVSDLYHREVAGSIPTLVQLQAALSKFLTYCVLRPTQLPILNRMRNEYQPMAQ